MKSIFNIFPDSSLSLLPHFARLYLKGTWPASQPVATHFSLACDGAEKSHWARAGPNYRPQFAVAVHPGRQQGTWGGRKYKACPLALSKCLNQEGLSNDKVYSML